ncbi:hypothetical protein AJ79_10281 [Helicocarpus griseus UAMH5409]|uniref:Uncharacterized protein n=1 Tax=Helicocarpus griseus UAMH5409 TaxID=1447875 RepID=A0A2B7WEV8_9EURO|nr:hypothetical protein AJ79_10281 [Helicocarpus griseus UAMH5409]
MAALPNQQNPANTYYANLGTQLEIDKLANGDKENAVTGIWNSILHKIYPAEQGYVVRPEHIVQNGVIDLSAIQ